MFHFAMIAKASVFVHSSPIADMYSGLKARNAVCTQCPPPSPLNHFAPCVVTVELTPKARTRSLTISHTNMYIH